MKNRFQLWLGFILVLPAFPPAFAGGIPQNATVFRQLNCTAQLSGNYLSVSNVVIQDVTYQTPPATFTNYNSRIDLMQTGEATLEGVLNESNGVDPQEFRDSGTLEDSGAGGIAMYQAVAQDGSEIEIMTRTESPFGQRNLPQRVYQVWISKVGPVGETTISTGQLNCQLQIH